MKKQIRLLPLLAILWAASTAHAQVGYSISLLTTVRPIHTKRVAGPLQPRRESTDPNELPK